MAQRVVHRPARQQPPRGDLAPIELVAPPPVPDSGGGLAHSMQVVLPILGGGGSLLMFVSYGNPIMLVAGTVMLAVTVVGGVVMFVAQRSGSARRFATQRRRYLDYLDEKRDVLRDSRREQRLTALHRHPDPAGLVHLVSDPHRLWERRLADADFLVVRIGLGQEHLWRRVTLPVTDNPLVELDPITQAAATLLVERDRVLGAMPVAVPLDGVVSVVGPLAETRNVVRAITAQIVALHAPDDVRIAWCVGQTAVPEFEWVKWLPHSLDPDSHDGPAPSRLVAAERAAFAELLSKDLSRRVEEFAKMRRFGGGTGMRVRGTRLVTVVDQVSVGKMDLVGDLAPDVAGSDLGVSTVVLVPQRSAEPSHVDVRVTCAGGEVLVEDLRKVAEGDDDAAVLARRLRGAPQGRADVVTVPQVETFARHVSPLRLVPDKNDDAPLEATIDLRGLLDIEDEATYDVETLWAPRPSASFLTAPFAVGHAAQRVVLDIKEAAQHGMGPHGLCVGATGSGKSEVLRTLVLTLAMTHPPERLALVLVDYKGGATFAGMGPLPHTSAMISNLSDDTGLVDRLREALQGEMKRRQEILLETGNLPNVTEYNRRRDAGEPLAPLPNLLVVIDEFGELLTAKPDFIELFLNIGRIGRSIGVHLLLASQRLEEGKLRGLESFLSYRIGLKTFNEQESRTVLNRPDAYHLPPLPGSGYLKFDTTVFARFKAAYVSGPYRPPAGQEVVDAPPMPAPFPLYNETNAWLKRANPTTPTDTDDESAGQHSTLDVVVQRLNKHGNQAHRIWLPPLPSALPLDAVTGELTEQDAYGLTVVDATARGRLVIPIGLLDRPAEQSQESLMVDLAGAGGHLCVMGAPQTGKSTLLRTLLLGAAITHTPNDLGFYCVDLSGGMLGQLAGLPHVAGIAGRLDTERVRRTVTEVATQLDERERLFTEHGIDSAESMRELHRTGRLPQVASADIVLLIDNYLVLKNDYEDLVDLVHDIAGRGLGYGVHLVLTTGRWADLRMQLQATIGAKIELALNDPLDSSIERKAADNVRSAETPGRCLTTDKLIGQVALPRLDGVNNPATAQTALGQSVERIARAWTGPRVPELRMLPTLVTVDQLPPVPPHERRARLGVDEGELRTVFLDLFGADQHLLVLGDAGSGKTNLMRLLIHDLTSRLTDDEVVFAVMDVRRTLLDAVPEDYRGAYAPTAQIVAGLSATLAQELRARLPSDDIKPAQLRDRSWWKGPEIVVLCDDYDLAATTGGPGPLAPLIEFLPQSRDLGFHLVLARRSGGANRALHEPLPNRMKEVGCAGLLLSGERQEGPIWPGTYLAPQPPGRGTLVRKGRKSVLIQTAHIEHEGAERSER